jgi:hypothetical protein
MDGDSRPSRAGDEEGPASFPGGFSAARSESRGLLEGVDGAALPSQRPDRFEAGVVAGVGTSPAGAGLGR